MPHRMQALQRYVVGVIAGLSGSPSPADECGPETVADLLLLNIQHLLGHFFPGEAKIAFGRDESQAHAAAR